MQPDVPQEDLVWSSLEALRAQASSEAEVWRLDGLKCALEAFERSRTGADRGANMREAVRLSNQVLTLPRSWVEATAAQATDWARFGLTVSDVGRGDLRFALLDEDAQTSPFFQQLTSVCRLDTKSRRLFVSDVADGALRRLTHYSVYQNPTQKSAARALLTMPAGATLLATMPTGSGKSLLFQLGIRWWQELVTDEAACAIVVVPTVALALDHAATVRSMPGLEGSEALLGDMPSVRRTAILQAFERGEVPLLFMAPEAAFGAARLHLLRAAKARSERMEEAQGRLVGFIVDEAHIIESWGRTFRPDFQQLGALAKELREQNPQLRTVLLSATVDDAAEEVLRGGFAAQGSFLKVAAGVPRYEFDMLVHRMPDLVSREDLVVRVADFVPRPALIYATTREDARVLHDRLRKEGGYERLALFTGDTEDDERRAILERWRTAELDLIVATSAFGMGVDKPNVRTVIHACLPEDAQRYYQEIGRGARDGHQALALCLWTEADQEVAESLAMRQLMSIERTFERWRALIVDCQDRRGLDFSSLPGRVLMDLSLEAAPPDLVHKTGAKNRRWNRSLINMLQRAGALEVRSVLSRAVGGTDRERWQVLVLDPRILDNDVEARSIIYTYLQRRNAEQERTYTRVRTFHHILTSECDLCQLALIFEQVEAGSPLVSPCGRCNVCRSRHQEPPDHVSYGGLRAVWPDPAPTPSAILHRVVLHPDGLVGERLPALALNLTALGISQWIVPVGWENDLAEQLSSQAGNPALVLNHLHILGGEWSIARAPTAVVVDPSLHDRKIALDLTQRLLEQFKVWPEAGLVFIVPDGLELEGRPFSQFAGHAAPLSEAMLTAMKRGVPS